MDVGTGVEVGVGEGMDVDVVVGTIVGVDGGAVSAQAVINTIEIAGIRYFIQLSSRGHPAVMVVEWDQVSAIANICVRIYYVESIDTSRGIKHVPAPYHPRNAPQETKIRI